MSRAWGEFVRRRLILALAGLVVLVVVLVVAARAIQLASLLYLFYIGASLALGGVASTTLIWMLHAWRTPDSLSESRLADDGQPSAHSFSLIVPARHEEAVLGATLARLATCEHPEFEVIVVVGSDDHATREVAERMADRHPGLIRVVVDSSWPKSKPRALNAALPHCTGTVTGVFDAEDDVHPGLLQRVDQCFQRTGADVVQAGVQLMNFKSSWLTVHNVLEYYFWFRSRLHLHARQRFIPLGGNTVFIRTGVLRAVHGWDPDCLAEDCELGVRLSAAGARTVVFYEPDLVTREECPPALGAFVRQRTRWNQGYLQTLSRGYWRRLPLRQRLLGAYILAMPFVLAIAWLLVPVAIATAVTLKAPVPITLTSFLPLLPLLGMLVAEVAGLGEFCRVYAERASLRDYARLVVGLPFYQVVLSFAAARSAVREARGIRGWEKTSHLGLHLAPQTEREGMRRGSRAGGLPWQTAFTFTVIRAWHWRWARPSRAAVGRGDVARTSVAYALAQGPGSPHEADRMETDEMSVNTLVSLAADPPLRAPIELSPRNGAARPGNGHGAWPPDLGEILSTGNGGAPLWARLDGRPAAGPASAASPGKPFRGSAPGPRWRRAAAAAGRAVSSRPGLALPVALLAVVAAVLGTNLLHWPAPGFDEGGYIGQAWAVSHGALDFYTYGYGHPPLTWLLIFLWVEAGGIFGHVAFSIDSGREFMFVVDVVSCALMYVLARRLGFSRLATAGAVLLFGISPLALFYHRQVLLNNPAMAFVLAAFILAWTPRRSLWAFAASGVCFAAGVLCKETALLVLPGLLVAVFQNSDRRTRRYGLPLFVTSFLLVGGFYPLYATLKGELFPGPGHVSLIGYVIVQLFTRKATGSLFNPHSQTYATVASWLHLDPWLLGISLLLVPVALARRSTRAIAIVYLVLFLMILRPGYLPDMYVINMLPFAALIVPGSVEALWRWSPRMPSRALVWPMRAAVSGLALAMAVVAAPGWARTSLAATTVRLDRPERAAQRWIVTHISRNKRIIVDDNFWIYLIEHGFNDQRMPGGFFSRTVVFFWNIDYDPAVKRAFPDGWRSYNYVVEVQGMRDSLSRNPTTAAAIAHSRVVVSFGKGNQLIQVREIEKTTSAASHPAPSRATSGDAHPSRNASHAKGRTVYTVKHGDSLATIAARHHTAGGWQVLYQANMRTIGKNPNLIYPGERLNP